MSSPPAHAVRQLKTLGEHPVWLVHRPGEQPRTLKTWTLTTIRRIQLALGMARPQRQMAGARLLERAGVRTPALCGGWRIGRRDGPVIELEHVFIQGRSALELFRDPDTPAAEIRRVSAAVGDVVAAMLRADLLNRDFKLNNVIVADDGPVWIIDTDAVRRSGRRVRNAARMLERLGVQLPLKDSPAGPEVWLPAMRRALRPVPAADRREVARLLRSHRRS